MSIPLVVNRAPAAGTVAGVVDSSRFSARDADTEIDRSTLQVYLGSGQAQWSGEEGTPPDDSEKAVFEFKAFNQSTPLDPALREMVGSLLKITKSGIGSKEGTYLFGGLQAPAEDEDPLMVEFTLKLDVADVTQDGNDFSGVAFGFFSGAKGVAVKFLYDGVNYSIEVHDAGLATTSPPSGAYVVPSTTYDWNAVESTYKLLWHPGQDKLRLYVSMGDDDTPDLLLVDGAVSDFPNLPADEQRDVTPLAFFGHIEADAESISYWGMAALHNYVATAVYNGVVSGPIEGFIRTNEVHRYDASEYPDRYELPWNPLPSSFGSLGGTINLVSTGLQLVKDDPSKSVGYYRTEPKVASGMTVFDFTAWASVVSLPAGSVHTGIEFFVDDGTKVARVVFLQDSNGTNYVGIMTDDSAPGDLPSYLAVIQSFETIVDYRLYFVPGVLGYATLSFLVESGDGGVTELVGPQVVYNHLPSSSMPNPGLGVLLNGNDSQAVSKLDISRMRYSLAVSRFTPNDVASPPSGWTKEVAGSGSITQVGGTILIDDGAEGTVSHAYLTYLVSNLQPDNGVMIEARMWVQDYRLNGESQPIRQNAHIGIILDDGTNRIALLFADAGELGRVAYFATNEDLEQNLLDIRNQEEAVEGTYAILDWTIPRQYRVERTVGGDLNLFVDDSAVPLLGYDEVESPSINTVSAGVFIGGTPSQETHSISVVEDVKVAVSNGLDVSLRPIIGEEDQGSRFDSSVNVIVEVEDI